MLKIYGNHLALIGVTGAGLALLAYVLFGPSDKPKSSKKRAFCGLKNLGTTCYLNTLLQSLASCPTFIQWLNQQSKVSIVSYTLNKTLQFLTGVKNSDDGVVSPIELVNILKNIGFQFQPHIQADAHELFVHLFSVIEEEAYKTSCSLADCLETTNDVINKEETLNGIGIKINETFTSTSGAGDVQSNTSNENSLNKKNFKFRGDKKLIDKNQNIKPPPFLGYLSNNIECSLCNHKSSLNYEKFYVISLNLPETPQMILRISDLLDQYIKIERLESLPCVNCDKNNAVTQGKSFIKSVKFGKLPLCFCIHLVRTQYTQNKLLKRKDFVEFPEYLKMDKYTSIYDQLSKLRQSRETLSPESIERFRGDKYIYRLKAVIVHAGEDNAGHFSTYRRGVSTKHSRHRWFYTSDDHIQEVTLQDVQRSIAYMLFYEKCDV
ncbi:ubiquitin carboxyl-terminal hydrolase 30 homolog isoform X2 [Daktulosphaira vitifoliae]|uniref:ubiquitin carboxyl-terminal hydrolase 30 homolog isoform X2 n=1 Tax=Daktulosphaira vitifoliae TaxID=58002 RepID=UPI0021AA191E|nr:ubiquitin carboxyl-terminal hydrolase 30 homolog isoform X2 [Daktulosphaira vitifoliae]